MTPDPPVDDSRQLFWERVKPLGELRGRILACMSSDNPRVPAFFSPPDGQPLIVAIEHHWRALLVEFGDDRHSRLLCAAGLLSCGDIDQAAVILSDLPLQPVVLDHGAGWCNLLPYRVAAAVLPVPAHLQEYRQWIRGSSVEAELLAWLGANREKLSWDGERFAPS